MPNYEEYNEVLNKIITDPDSAGKTVEELRDNLKADLTTFETLKKEAEELTKTVDKLRETNMHYFQRLQSPSPEANQNDPDQAIQELIKNWGKKDA